MMWFSGKPQLHCVETVLRNSLHVVEDIEPCEPLRPRDDASGRVERMHADFKAKALLSLDPHSSVPSAKMRHPFVCGTIQVCTLVAGMTNERYDFTLASSATLSLNMTAKNNITTNANPAGNHQNWFHCGSDRAVPPARKRL
jgi:hypothetical protein